LIVYSLIFVIILYKTPAAVQHSMEISSFTCHLCTKFKRLAVCQGGQLVAWFTLRNVRGPVNSFGL